VTLSCIKHYSTAALYSKLQNNTKRIYGNSQSAQQTEKYYTTCCRPEMKPWSNKEKNTPTHTDVIPNAMVARHSAALTMAV